MPPAHDDRPPARQGACRRGACRHCGRDRTLHRRHLCDSCYRRPEVRDLYPPLPPAGYDDDSKLVPLGTILDRLDEAAHEVRLPYATWQTILARLVPERFTSPPPLPPAPPGPPARRG